MLRTYEFGDGAGPPHLSTLVIAQAMAAAELEDTRPRRRITRGPRLPDHFVSGTGVGVPDAGEGRQWVCVGPLRSEMLGRRAPAAVGTWVRCEDALISLAENEVSIFLAVADADADKLVEFAQKLKDPHSTPTGTPRKRDKNEVKAEDELDARVMAIFRSIGGERRRNFRDAVELLTCSVWDHWPVLGPRTFVWCCQFMAEHSTHPLAHHGRFLQLVGLAAGEPGARDHEQAMRKIEFCLCFDQLQGGELACMELAAREAQMVELRYRDRVMQKETASVDDDLHIYMGTGKTRGLLMISPELEEFVATELARETAARKERRKMREERALARPGPTTEASGSGGGGGGGGGKKK